MNHIFDGKSDKEIAERLGIAAKTVRDHIEAVGKQVGVAGRYPIAIKALNIRRPDDAVGLESPIEIDNDLAMDDPSDTWSI